MNAVFFLGGKCEMGIFTNGQLQNAVPVPPPLGFPFSRLSHLCLKHAMNVVGRQNLVRSLTDSSY